jgi:hypothetical protein
MIVQVKIITLFGNKKVAILNQSSNCDFKLIFLFLQKKIMQVSEYKAFLHHEIDSLNDQNLTKVFGFISNLKNEAKGNDVWLNTSKSDINKILEGLADLENGRTFPHNIVMEKMRMKVANA